MPTKSEADGNHPSDHYLVVEDAGKPTTWHLRVKGADGKPDHRLMGAAWAALHGGYRGNKYEGPGKADATSKLKALYEKEELPVPSEKERQTGIMVAWILPETTALVIRLAAEKAGIPSSVIQPTDQMHLTLAYLGEMENQSVTRDVIDQAVADFASKHVEMEGKINGVGRFDAIHIEGASALYATVDIPGLPEMRQELVEALEAAGATVDRGHGFTPHVTIAYIPIDAPMPDVRIPPMMAELEAITLAWGDLRSTWELAEPEEPALAQKERSTFAVFKAKDGRYRWLTISSSAYRDAEGETISTKALEDDCERADKDGDYGPLRWQHVGEWDDVSMKALGGLDLGDCDWNTMYGRLLVESGTFRDERIGQKAATWPPMEVSIGFFRRPPGPDKVHHQIKRFERSLLPAGRASNLFTSFMVAKKEANPMADKGKAVADLKALLGDDELTSKVVAQLEAKHKEADASGVGFKEKVAKILGDLTGKKPDPAPAPAATPPAKTIGEMSAAEFAAALKEALAPASAPAPAQPAPEAEKKEDAQAALKEAQSAQAQRIEKLEAALKGLLVELQELNGKPGYRPTQDGGTVVATKETGADGLSDFLVNLAGGAK